MYVIDSEVLLFAYNIYSQDAKEKKLQQCKKRSNCCHWQSFLWCIRQLLFKHLCASLFELQLLALFFLSSITYIPFSHLFLCPVNSLALWSHSAHTGPGLTLTSDFGSRVCFWDNFPLHAQCIMGCFTSQSSCIMYMRLPVWNWTERCPPIHPSTGHCITCINCFSLHTRSCWIALLANTCSCMQPATSQCYLLLATIIHFLQF